MSLPPHPARRQRLLQLAHAALKLCRLLRAGTAAWREERWVLQQLLLSLLALAQLAHPPGSEARGEARLQQAQQVSGQADSCCPQAQLAHLGHLLEQALRRGGHFAAAQANCTAGRVRAWMLVKWLTEAIAAVL